MPEGARFCPECGARLAAPPPASDTRRIITVVFIDLVGSTELAESLDPEALRRTMDGYYEACTSAITERGGVVEKFIGDAVMAVFGAFVTQEDDALHAVQAACAVREAVAGDGPEPEGPRGVRLDVHCGIASGEAVVAGTVGGGARVVGDVVHTAARLQSHAQAHEILIGDETARLAGAGVRREAVAPLRLKGKRDPVTAWRVLGLPDGPVQADLVPLVGRETELEFLVGASADGRRERRCVLVTVTGLPGIGKSRLVREFLATPAAAGATVLRGTCQPYGAGSAYRPLAEALWSLPGGWEEAVTVLKATDPQAERAAGALRVAFGVQAESGPAVSVDEIRWAFRRLVGALSRTEPLILVLEDFHWAQPALLDVVSETAAAVTDAEVALVCVGRPESPTAWHPAGVRRLSVDALPVRETERLVRLLADRGETAAQQAVGSEDTLSWIVQECDGNPLFAELLLEDLFDQRAAVRGVPTTIRVLLTAWLDRLPGTDREVLERAAGVGGSFTAADVSVLAADAPALTRPVIDASVRSLLHTRVIQPAGPPGLYRFARVLARDTLYEMTSKARRAAWHTALADRLDRARPGDPAGATGTGEDLAHHLESAHRLLSAVDPGDPSLPALTRRAARALTETGYRALRRRDLPGAVSLMERGRALTEDGDREHRVLAVRLTDAYAGLGRWDSARRAVEVAEERAGHDRSTRDTCSVLRRTIALRSGDPAVDDPAGAPADDDHLSWCRLHQLRSLRAFAQGRAGAAESAMREALERARGGGTGGPPPLSRGPLPGRHDEDRDQAAPVTDAYEENRILVSICELTQWSPTPLGRAIALCEELAARFDADRSLLVPVLLTRARHLALSGRVGEAREDVALARRHCADLSLALGEIAADQTAGLVESLSGAHLVAARHYDEAADRLTALGQLTTAATLRVYATREHVRAGTARPALAETSGDVLEPRARAVSLVLRARSLAEGGEGEAAVAAVERAVAVLDRTDDPCLAGDVLFDAAQALHAAGAPERALRAARGALAALEAKEAVLPAAAVRTWLADREEEG